MTNNDIKFKVIYPPRPGGYALTTLICTVLFAHTCRLHKYYSCILSILTCSMEILLNIYDNIIIIMLL